MNQLITQRQDSRVCATEARTSHISTALDDLRRSVAGLMEQAENLLPRLAPVMRNEPPPPTTTKEEPRPDFSTPLASELCDLSNQVRMVALTLNNARQRLEL